MFIEVPAARSVRLAGSSHDVLVRRLHRGPEDATLNEVQFPPGWRRPAAGSFDVAEEVLWLDGGVAMSGIDHPAGSWSWLPAGCVRRASRSDGGARALAWFAGAPTWQPVAEAAADADSASVVVRVVANLPVAPGPVAGTSGRLLGQRPDGGRTWLLDGVYGGAAPAGGALVVPLDARGVLHVAAGDTLPHLDESLLVRTGAV